MLCKQENRDPAHCLKEGRKVTRCAAELYVSTHMIDPPTLTTIQDRQDARVMLGSVRCPLAMFGEEQPGMLPNMASFKRSKIDPLAYSTTKHAEYLRQH